VKKLWQKDISTENELANKVEQFTVGNDRNLDTLLAKYDVLGSLAHTKMQNCNAEKLGCFLKMSYHCLFNRH
jgi:hypothetical protein